MLASSSLVSFVRNDREYAMLYVCYGKKFKTTFHFPELYTYVRTPQRDASIKNQLCNLRNLISFLITHFFIPFAFSLTRPSSVR